MAYRMAQLSVTFKVTFAVWNLSSSHSATVIHSALSTTYLHMNRKAHMASHTFNYLLAKPRTKDFSRSQPVMYTLW